MSLRWIHDFLWALMHAIYVYVYVHGGREGDMEGKGHMLRYRRIATWSAGVISSRTRDMWASRRISALCGRADVVRRYDMI